MQDCSIYNCKTGVNPEIVMEWTKLIVLGRDESAYRHFQNFFQSFLVKSIKLNAFHVGNWRYEYIDGTVRHYIHKSARK